MTMISNQAYLKELINASVSAGASDLHLSVGTMPAARIDHQLQTINKELILTTEFVQDAASFLAGLDGREVGEGSEMSFAVSFEGSLRLKVNIFFQKGLPAVTIRFIPRQFRALDQLGLPSTVKRFAELKRGLVIIAGPYGSGRSSTLAALIQEINAKRREYIMTLEKPIEYIFNSQLSIVEQREIGRDTPSFERALDYLKQEDVDVLMISELSSAKAIISALEIANSGVLVLTASDADSATGVIDKLNNSFEGQKQRLVRRLFAEVIEGIVVQRLIPRLGGGQVPAVELLIATEPVRLAIKEGNTHQIQNILITSSREGMISLDRHLFDLVRNRVVNREDALKQAVNPDSLEKMMKRGIR